MLYHHHHIMASSSSSISRSFIRSAAASPVSSSSSSSFPLLFSSMHFSSSSHAASSSPSTSSGSNGSTPQKEQEVLLQSKFFHQFWEPVNEQRARNNGELIKESFQKFQMQGHVQKMMGDNAALSSSSSSGCHFFDWFGLQTNHPQVVENFLIFLSTGFDILRVVDNTSTGAADNNSNSKMMLLEHSRNFLGWKPKPFEIPVNSSSAVCDNDTTHHNNPNLISLPFQSTVELTLSSSPNTIDTLEVEDVAAAAAEEAENSLSSSLKFNRITFDCDLVGHFQKHTDCPSEVLSCLRENENSNIINRQSVKMVVALRRAGVRPEIISYRALKSATKKTSTWASALGVM